MAVGRIARVGLAAVLAVGGLALYLHSGDRLTGASGLAAMPARVGVESHAGVGLDTGGGTIELRSATVVADRELRAEVRLMRSDEGASGYVGSASGPLGQEYTELPIRNQEISAGRSSRYWLDIRMTPTDRGIYFVEGLIVTYRDGWLRERTAYIAEQFCVAVGSDPADTSDCP